MHVIGAPRSLLESLNLMSRYYLPFSDEEIEALRDLRVLLKVKKCSFCQVMLHMDPYFFQEDG